MGGEGRGHRGSAREQTQTSGGPAATGTDEERAGRTPIVLEVGAGVVRKAVGLCEYSSREL